MNWQKIIHNTVVVMGFMSPAAIIITAVLCSGCLSGDKQPAPYTELTQRYQLPPELKDCRIYGLAWGWSDRKPLVVIVPKDGIKGPQILD